MIELGKRVTLEVVRKTDLGYMLTDGMEEVLMHYKQSDRELEIHEKANVYIYSDKENRKTATMQEARLEMGKPNFVQVVSQMASVGVFVDNQTPKDLLVSKNDLPEHIEDWPREGDTLYCALKQKKDALTARPLHRFEIDGHERYEEQQMVKAYVQHLSSAGMGLVSSERTFIFVPYQQYRGHFRMGEEVMVRITKQTATETYGTLNLPKENLIEPDKQMILDYFSSHTVLPLTAKSSTEEVARIFPISRKAFKRAYGALYKEKKIFFDEKNTYLKSR